MWTPVHTAQGYMCATYVNDPLKRGHICGCMPGYLRGYALFHAWALISTTKSGASEGETDRQVLKIELG